MPIGGIEFKPQYSLPLAQQVTQFLTNAIVCGQIRGGERLVENELQRKLGISRAPIRESFRILEKNGLVATNPRKGTYVRVISRKALEEHFPIRANLEGLCARLAVPNLTSEDIREMESALSGMRIEAKKHSFETHLKYHSEFHQVIWKASKNDSLIEIVQNLSLQATWFRFSYLHLRSELIDTAFDIHQRMLDFFIKRDSDGAEAFMKEHILRTLNRFIELSDQGI